MTNIFFKNTFRVLEIVYIRLILWPKLKSNFFNKRGLEVGGPSKIFMKFGIMPIYSASLQVDVCNFSSQTVWEGALEEGFNFDPDGVTIGRQIICDGSNMPMLQNESCDFILSCHNLEHFANPLKAIAEWLRILKSGGILLLVLPDPTKTFDRTRKITSFNHLKEDYIKNTSEDDFTHIDEIIRDTDLSIFPLEPGETIIDFIELCNSNSKNRCAHHHVFDFQLLDEIFNYFKISKVVEFKSKPFHLVIIGKK